MAAEITDITERNRPDILDHFRAASPLPPDATDMLAHILTDLHEALQLLTRQGLLLAKHDALLEEFRPLIDRLRSPLASRLPGGKRRD